MGPVRYWMKDSLRHPPIPLRAPSLHAPIPWDGFGDRAKGPARVCGVVSLGLRRGVVFVAGGGRRIVGEVLGLEPVAGGAELAA